MDLGTNWMWEVMGKEESKISGYQEPKRESKDVKACLCGKIMRFLTCFLPHFRIISCHY